MKPKCSTVLFKLIAYLRIVSNGEFEDTLNDPPNSKNENDVYDENAEIDNNQPTTMGPKFPKEGRSSNGVALTMNKNTDGSEYEKGIRLKPFFILEKK